MRKLLVAFGALAAGVLAPTFSNISWASPTTAAVFSGQTSISAAPRSDPAATAQMKAALRHGGAKSSLHYVSTSVGSGITTTIVGDVGKTVGTQTIYVRDKKVTATMVIRLVGHEAYFKGAAAAIYVLIGLTPAQSDAAAGRWISVVPSDSVYQSIAAALTVGSVMSELALSQPIVGTRDVMAEGQPALEISGAWTGNGITAKDHATGALDVTRGARSLPVSFSGVEPKNAKTSRFTSRFVVSHWGESVDVAPPAFSVPLSTILKATTTTTAPVVV